jgi:hypothetical protein
MRAIQISDSLYVEAQRAAAASGLSIEKFVAEAVRTRLHRGEDDLDHRFTSEVIAALDRAAAQADNGQTITFDQYDAEFKSKREAWLREHANSL